MKTPRGKKSPSFLKNKSNCSFEEGYIIKYHSRSIEYRHRVYDIQVPEIWRADAYDTPHMVILPEYLLPRKWYPIQIYLYAINEYCNGRSMSQRKAAEKAIKLFGLTTFAHTTLGRALKRLYKVIGDIEKAQSISPEVVEGSDTTDEDTAAGNQDVGGLPRRCKRIKSFFNEWLPQHDPTRYGFEAASHIMVRRMWQLFQVLLI